MRAGFGSSPGCAGPVLAALLLTGCVSAVPALRLVHAECLRREEAIITRTGTTAERDIADMRAEHARCDAERAAARGQK
jgi:hypothetical protein